MRNASLTPDFQEAVHEKNKPSQPEREKKQVSVVFKIKPRKWDCQFYVTFIPHLTEKQKDISHRNFPHNTSPNVFNVVYICHIPSVLIQKCLTCYSIHYNIMILLADSFIQSDVHCIQGIAYISPCRIKPMILSC